MKEIEKIRGSKILPLIEMLHEEGILIKVQTPKRTSTHLSMIIGIRPEGERLQFQMDPTEELKGIFAGGKIRNLIFEFRGEDRLFYSFRTSSGEIRGNEIWIKFPEHIVRMQRREHFRLGPPLGTNLIVTFAEREHTMNVLDVSMKGARVMMEREAGEKPLLKKGDLLTSLSLVLPEEEGPLKVSIKKAKVTIVEKGPPAGHHQLGIHFSDLPESDKRKLRAFIYREQRRLLRKR